jgi:hypothetical protein
MADTYAWLALVRSYVSFAREVVVTACHQKQGGMGGFRVPQ